VADATQNQLARWLPGFQVLPQFHDFVAGIVLTTMLVPGGIAHAAASGIPGFYGL